MLQMLVNFTMHFTHTEHENSVFCACSEIATAVENMDEYDTVIIAHPIWHGIAPRIISTFLESYDFSGKTLRPITT